MADNALRMEQPESGRSPRVKRTYKASVFTCKPGENQTAECVCVAQDNHEYSFQMVKE